MNNAYILPQDSTSIEKAPSNDNKESEPIFTNSAITGGTMGKANVKEEKEEEKKASKSRGKVSNPKQSSQEDYTIEFDSIQASRVEEGNKTGPSRVQTPARGHPVPKSWYNPKKPEQKPQDTKVIRQNTPIPSKPVAQAHPIEDKDKQSDGDNTFSRLESQASQHFITEAAVPKPSAISPKMTISADKVPSSDDVEYPQTVHTICQQMECLDQAEYSESLQLQTIGLSAEQQFE